MCFQRAQGLAVSLPILTYVLVSVALLCLGVALLVFLCVKGLHSNSNSIHINLVFVMFTTLLIFLCGIDKASNEVNRTPALLGVSIQCFANQSSRHVVF